jgi:organic hydroperoxide reductase OsmC/OhrA
MAITCRNIFLMQLGSMMEVHYYNVNVAWHKDRRGMMWSPELNRNGQSENCIEVATPPEFPKGIPGIWSPEHLFTASVSTCFMTTFLAVAENSKLDFKSFTCQAKGKLDTVDGKLQMTEVDLEPVLCIASADDRDKALRVLAKAEQACLITHSVNAVVRVTPVVEVP